jgi:hypothetical protein
MLLLLFSDSLYFCFGVSVTVYRDSSWMRFVSIGEDTECGLTSESCCEMTTSDRLRSEPVPLFIVCSSPVVVLPKNTEKYKYIVSKHRFMICRINPYTVESSLFVVDQCSWISWGTLTNEFTSPRTIYYFLFHPYKYYQGRNIYWLPMK